MVPTDCSPGTRVILAYNCPQTTLLMRCLRLDKYAVDRHLPIVGVLHAIDGDMAQVAFSASLPMLPVPCEYLETSPYAFMIGDRVHYKNMFGNEYDGTIMRYGDRYIVFQTTDDGNMDVDYRHLQVLTLTTPAPYLPLAIPYQRVNGGHVVCYDYSSITWRDENERSQATHVLFAPCLPKDRLLDLTCPMPGDTVQLDFDPLSPHGASFQMLCGSRGIVRTLPTDTEMRVCVQTLRGDMYVQEELLTVCA